MPVSIRGSGQVPVQIASSTLTSSLTTTSTSPVDTGLTVTITPTSSSNKIYISAMCYGNGTSGLVYNLVRNGTAIAQGTGGTYNGTGISFTSSQFQVVGNHMSFLDSPATTSAVTYKVQIYVDSGTGAINRRTTDNAWAACSSITVMEISGT